MDIWKIKGMELKIEKPVIMGILNVTPDSFYDGGRYFEVEEAVKRGKEMEKEGADIIDVGGESSRPGSHPVSEKEEMERVLPVIKELSKEVKIPISIDTYKSKVAEEALKEGARIVNDISALRFDRKMVDVIRDYKAGVVLMHMKGRPSDMQKNPYYEDTVGEIYSFLEERIKFCEENGIEKEQIVIDPGIGFGKRLIDNLLILKNIHHFLSLGRPILIGTSRKSFIGFLLNLPVEERLEGTISSVIISYLKGVSLFRVHDVKEIKRALSVAFAIENPEIYDENTVS
ncbi:MAG: dihydropteroate synthase [Candidatus Omnitrophota bacterium]|nr:MAG: dihydropteroate synthase [Candidatus Omnitrophota bacterium]